MWSPEDENYVGTLAEVWTGLDFEHYARFPIPSEEATISGVQAVVPEAGAIRISKRGALGVVSVLKYWVAPKG